MEERYEILGKIGQGGLGAVYRAFDNRMSREVAIKRISNAEDDPELQEESTRQLVKEAGALASLQHPNIVTIHDVGADAEGPYVVMELINGSTLDELIENAPLTWQDFKELAMQTLEALIAAQERNLIHSDLKPSNLMLTWLPSGKFQIKIVDFGLATLSQSQTKQDLESIDVVFGSIFFMPPEQFERAPLDARSDMYSIGCVFYQALTGHYPFDGDTGSDVMEAHLQQKVIPLKDVRAGIPLWACDWIMWHINRNPQDRPESAREALTLFVQNDRVQNAAVSTGVPPVQVTPTGPPRKRMLAPVSVTKTPAGTATAAQAVEKAKMVQTSPIASVQPSGPGTKTAGTHTAPQALAPPVGFKPSVHASVPVIQEVIEPPPEPTATSKKVANPVPVKKQPFKLGKNGKIMIAAVVSLLLTVGGLFLLGGKNKRSARILDEMAARAEQAGVTEIPINSDTLELALNAFVKSDSDDKLHKLGAALAIAKATDFTDVDSRIADFVKSSSDMPVAAKEILINDVLRTRNNPVILPTMLELAMTDKNPATIVAALQSIRQMSGEDVFGKLLQLINTTTDNQVRDSAEANVSEMLRRSKNVAELTRKLSDARAANFKQDVQRTLQRLISLGKSLSS